MIEDLTAKNAHFRSLRDPIDTSTPQDQLMTLVADIHSTNPDLTLREIAAQLERLHERTPRGGSKWLPSSVKNLIDRARRSGLLSSTG